MNENHQQLKWTKNSHYSYLQGATAYLKDGVTKSHLYSIDSKVDYPNYVLRVIDLHGDKLTPKTPAQYFKTIEAAKAAANEHHSNFQNTNPEN